MARKNNPIDPYTYSNGILKNKLNIHDYQELHEAEKNITFTKFLNIQNFYARKFDSRNLKNIHKHIFEDIFSWAGNYRSVPIFKEEEVIIPGMSLDYSPVSEIDSRIDTVLSKMNKTNWKKLNLDEKSKEFAKDLTELWIIHPFRDGNTRTTITFATQFAKEHDFPLDLETLLPLLSRKKDNDGNIVSYSLRDYFLLSALPEYSEPEHLEGLLKSSMVKGIQKNISSLQDSLNGLSNKKSNNQSAVTNNNKVEQDESER